MISYFDAILLGLLQGFAELFPISSLGHTVLIPAVLHWPLDRGSDAFLAFLVLTHLATALVLVGFFWRDWLKIIGECTSKPIFAHVNWFQRDASDGHFLWPGYRENLRALLWLMQLRDGSVTGVSTPVGILPAKEELNLDGLDIAPEDLERVLTIDVDRWKQEIGFRQAHLEQFANLPEEIWAAHRRVAEALGD